MRLSLILLALTSMLIAAASAQTATDDAAAQQAALAKKSQNPVANMISVPFEFWKYDGENGDAIVGIVKPVVPTSLGNLNLINRFILPYASASGTIHIPNEQGSPTAVDANGLGDLTYQGFLSPAKPGKVIWGLGAALVVPIGSDDLSSDLWSVGPSSLLLSMPGNWVLGLLVQNVWSFAGSGDGSINKLTLQPIINYNLPKGWYLTSAPVITADWEADDDDVWSVPLGAGAGKLVKFGKVPVDLKAVYYSYVEKPTFGPDWGLLFSVKLLFPK